MKITDVNNLNNLIRTGAGVERQTQRQGPPSFRDTLSSLTRENSMQRLSEMSENLMRQGEVVGRRCDILELKRYKELLSEYLYEAVRFMYEFKKQSTLDARGRHKMYAIIKKINAKLEEMTEQMLKSESGSLALMAAVDDIRGMLIDLLL